MTYNGLNFKQAKIPKKIKANTIQLYQSCTLDSRSASSAPKNNIYKLTWNVNQSDNKSK